MVVDKEDQVRPEIGNARALAIYARAHAGRAFQFWQLSGKRQRCNALRCGLWSFPKKVQEANWES
jgi:hypothetical protein